MGAKLHSIFSLWAGVKQTSRARLFKEYKEVHREKGGDNDIQLTCDDTNIYRWTAYIKVHSISYLFISMWIYLDTRPN